MAVQMALLAKVLEAARPSPAPASPVQAATQAAASHALLQSVTALDLLASPSPPRRRRGDAGARRFAGPAPAGD